MADTTPGAAGAQIIFGSIIGAGVLSMLLASVVAAVPKGLALVGTVPHPRYAPLDGIFVAAVVLVSILLIAKYARGFISNIAVLRGIVIGGAWPLAWA